MYCLYMHIGLYFIPNGIQRYVFSGYACTVNGWVSKLV